MISDIVILAAGNGKRMCSATPKPLYRLGGMCLLDHVLATIACFSKVKIHVVVSPTNKAACSDGREPLKLHWVVQKEQRGTGHALAQVLPHLGDDGQTLVLYADVPLVNKDSLIAMENAAKNAALVLMTVIREDASGYGRIVRDSDGVVNSIVEELDANEAQKALKEVSTGIIVAHNNLLKSIVPTIKTNNKQKEYYLTDIAELAAKQGTIINTILSESSDEIMGINTQVDLCVAERVLQRRRGTALLSQGVQIADINRFDIRGDMGDVTLGRGIYIDVGVVLEGKVSIGDNVHIGAYCVIKDATIEAGTQIKPYSSIEESHIGVDCIVGPYARLRTGTTLAARAKIGNFVETKKTTVGPRTKISHLSYIGDAELAADVNIGAGVITCNYDGKRKHPTRVDQESFVGSNVSLIAPLHIGKRATVGAGSTISKDVPDDALAVERNKQDIRPNWKAKSKK